MANGTRSRTPILGAILLIVLGVLFLYANLDPSFSPWPFLARFWPVLIILWGLSKLLNYVRARHDPALARASRITGGEVFLLVVVIMFGMVLSAGMRHHGPVFSSVGPVETESKSVELAGAKSVRVNLRMRAGTLNLTGGADNLMDGEFSYNVAKWKPEIDYRVTGTVGRLKIEHALGTVHVGDADNEWNLRLNNDVPMELDLQMGAGRADLILGELLLNRVEVRGGAGDFSVDLTGDWKQDVDVEIKGGVGRLTVRLPQEVGVHVSAKGGIGGIYAHGLDRRGRAYVNDAYGKSDVTVRVNVKGGIGEINLETG
jgi:hypothetical protein